MLFSDISVRLSRTNFILVCTTVYSTSGKLYVIDLSVYQLTEYNHSKSERDVCVWMHMEGFLSFISNSFEN